jgi:NADH-quinone oxidoreductase subunit H
MVDGQAAAVFGVEGLRWNVFFHPIAALLMFIAALAEANRTPFDLAEAEQELVGGYHTEYSAMKLALFFLAEYTHMITSSALMATMFLGGYLVPGWTWLNTSPTVGAMFCRVGVLSFKIFLLICFYMLIRWTIPRFRFDQLMRLAWKVFIPASMALVAIQGVIVYTNISQAWALVGNIAVVLVAAMVAAGRWQPITGRQLSMKPVEVAVQR